MRSLRLMHDWDCWPLWSDDPVGNVDPESLPIEPELAGRLNRWSARYDSLLNRADPASTSVDTDSMVSLKREALDLWIALRAVLPADDFHVDLQWGQTRFADPVELPDGWMTS